MKRIKHDQTTSLTAPLTPPYFKPRRLAREINFHLKITALACVAVGVAATPAQAFEPVVQLSSLDGSTGFRLDGVTTDNRSGRSVSTAGDVNGDGIDDLLIGAARTSHNGISSGSSYVVFGRTSVFASAIDLSSLDGSNGFRLDGVTTNDTSGFSVSAAGDVNGDDIDDLLIGAPFTSPNGDKSGSSYVVFGRTSAFASAIDLSSLDGSSGFRLDGVTTNDNSGRSVSAAGDVNSDDIDDLLISAQFADPNGDDSGSSYVVFGRSTGFASAINLSSLDGNIGFRLDGETTNDRSGNSVSAAGDVNGDDIDDLLIGSFFADPNGSYSGASYVVFGRSTGFASAINLSSLDGSSGFRLDGVTAGDYFGKSVSAAGDVNGDGIDDLLISAYYADSNANDYSGSSYVVFGRNTGFASVIDLSSLDGSTGFRLDGVSENDYSGYSVSAAGDVNGDGIDDLLIGAYNAPNDNESGISYVVFGRSTEFASAIDLSSLDGSTGFRLDGMTNGDLSGISVSAAGDVNGDGIDDVLIGASGANPNGNSSGSSYVVFGTKDADELCVPIKSQNGAIAVVCL